MFSTAIIIKPETASALEGRAILNYDLKNYFSALYDISHALVCSIFYLLIIFIFLI